MKTVSRAGIYQTGRKKINKLFLAIQACIAYNTLVNDVKGAEHLKEEHIWTKKPETMLDWFCVVGACIALYLALNNLGYFLGKIGAFINILSPFAGGIVIAYVLDPMVKFFYTKLFKEKKKTRGFAILLAYLVAILLLVLLAWLVIPQIMDSVVMLFTNFPSYIQSVQDMLGMVQERFGVDLSSATKMLDDSEAMVKEIYSMASAAMPQIVASIGSVASNFVAIFTSIAASIYMLADKEHLLHQLRTVTHAFLPEKAAENTLRICHYANVNFTGFFVGKIIDSAIIGVITFVAMAILRLDFALLISVFIGITNIIPVFGPFIGAIPSIFILLLVDPIQAVIFGVLILVIQQVDGNFIGPKILGSSIGISALWILFSIVVGGDLFGLVGMVVGVPLFATFYGLAQEFVHYTLDKRGLDSEGNHVGEVVEDAENVFE